MQHFFYILAKYKYFLLFVLLEFLALFFTIQSHSYHQSTFVNSSNSVTGSLLNTLNDFDHYLNLPSENKFLLEENTRLKNTIINADSVQSVKGRALFIDKNFKFLGAEVIRNEYTKINNYLTINKGKNDSINNDIGAVNEKGIIGIVNSTSKKYATIISILNHKLKINIKLKNANYYGSLVWDGNDYNIMQMQDVPRQALLKKGDTIVTGGQSTIFPKGLPVGSILNWETDDSRYTKINIKLFNDMSAIGHVYLILNNDKKEILNLESANE
ncbi:MAG: rod shape-determining protein MreC [Flavobacteriaceae bacterium]